MVEKFGVQKFFGVNILLGQFLIQTNYGFKKIFGQNCQPSTMTYHWVQYACAKIIPLIINYPLPQQPTPHYPKSPYFLFSSYQPTILFQAVVASWPPEWRLTATPTAHANMGITENWEYMKHREYRGKGEVRKKIKKKGSMQRKGKRWKWINLGNKEKIYKLKDCREKWIKRKHGKLGKNWGIK